MPYLFAPEAQTHVPYIVWMGTSSDMDYVKTLARRDTPNSHDMLSYSLLEAFGVEAQFYEKPEPVARLLYTRH